MFTFEIHGNPVPQKQTRTANGRFYDPSKQDKERIQWHIKPFAPEIPLNSPVELTIAFFMPIPKSASKALRTQMINRVILPSKKPDEDNLAYLITNALKGIVYIDDAQVCAKHVYKFYGQDPKTVIRVRPILQAQPLGYQDANDI
jgi:Holliday junction resolvase RusA-like endonuclease